MPIKGFSTQSKKGRESFATIQDVGGGRKAIETIQHGIVEIPGSLVIAAISDYELSIIAHGATESDFLRINGIVYVIEEVVDANSLKLTEKCNAAVNDAVTIMKSVQVRLAADGSMITTSGPIRYIRDNVETTVLQDTAVAANNRGLPVEIVAASGDINITAGDIGVQLSHDATNPDSTRIGDGVTELGIKAGTKEALVHDEDSLVELQSILAKIIAAPSTEAKQDTAITALSDLLTELQLKADLTETQPVSQISQPLPTGASTEAKQDTTIVSLASLLTELQLKADLTETQPVSLASTPLPSGASIESKQDDTITALGNLLAELQLKSDLTETQPVSLASAPLAAGASTEAKQDDNITALGSLLTELQLKANLTETQPISAADLPLPTGAAIETKQDSIIAALDAIRVSSEITNNGVSLIDAGTTTINGSAGATVEIDASCPVIKKIQALDTTGYYLVLYTGASGSEVMKCIFGPGADYTIPVDIPAGTRLSIRNLDTTSITSGKIVLNYFA